MSLRNPVKYPVKYYSWQDDQAPQLSNVDGAIKTILKACLVTGYGSKAGAGWTALFEDAYRIVLRRPLRTGNPPDIKIENGTISGSTKRHRIVAQDNPTGLGYTKELLAINLLARDALAGTQWHCVVTDFAFFLCYQMAENGYEGDRNMFLYWGEVSRTQENIGNIHLITGLAGTGVDGTHDPWAYGFINNENFFVKNIRTKTNLPRLYLDLGGTETAINNDYFAQLIFLDNVAVLPFYTASTSSINNNESLVVSIENRQMLRTISTGAQGLNSRAFYIPLDYWGL